VSGDQRNDKKMPPARKRRAVHDDSEDLEATREADEAELRSGSPNEYERDSFVASDDDDDTDDDDSAGTIASVLLSARERLARRSPLAIVADEEDDEDEDDEDEAEESEEEEDDEYDEEDDEWSADYEYEYEYEEEEDEEDADEVED